MSLTIDQIADAVIGIQRDLGALKWTEIATSLVHYEGLTRILTNERVQFGTGRGIQRQLMKRTSGQAKHTGLMATDSVDLQDLFVQMDIPWRHTTTAYMIDRVMVAMDRSPLAILNLVKTQRVASLIDLAVLIEEAIWDKPTNSADNLKPFGLKYWVVKNATQGFNGGNPAGFAAGAGNVDSSVVTRWANYTDQYVNVTKTDLIRKMRKASRQTGFMSPVPHPSYARGPDRFVIYTTENVVEALEEVGEAQNENLGRDIASMDGRIMFHGNPVRWIHFLDQDVTDPIYHLNWANYYPIFLQGEYLNESRPLMAPNQHTVSRVFIDMTWNMLAVNRRLLSVISK